MRVGVIAYPLDRPVAGGIDRYIHRMAREIAREEDRDSFVWIHGAPFPQGHPLHGAREVILPEHGLRAAVARRKWGRLNPEGLSVLWGPYFGVLPGPFVKVITVHDLYALKGRDGGWLQTMRFRATTRRMVRESDWVLVVSEATRRQVLASFPIEPMRVPMVHHGVDPPPARDVPRAVDRAHLRKAYGWPEDARVVLFVSTLVKRKDPATLVRAFATVHARVPQARLLFFGHPAGAYRDAVAACASSGLAAGEGGVVRFAKQFDEASLETAYAGADVLSLPSHFEGFGMPALEAMARGLPAVLSTGGSLPEIAGDAALYHPVGDAPALAQALERVLTDGSLAHELAAKGRARAAAFSWERAADETLEVMRKASELGARAA